MKFRNVFEWRGPLRQNPRLYYACYTFNAKACATAAGKHTSQQLLGLQECTDPDRIAACKARPDVALEFQPSAAELLALGNARAATAVEREAALMEGLKAESLRLFAVPAGTVKPRTET